MTGRSGRRAGKPDTRGAILAAAREAFGARGFDRASVRGIAADAGVDPALVHHYFGTKEQLFQATLAIPIDPGQVLSTMLDGDRDRVGENLVAAGLAAWDSPAGVAAAALLRSAMTSEWSARLLREFLLTQVLRRVRRRLDLDGPDADWRLGLAASQMAGLLVMRYLLRMEPLASAPRAQIVTTVGPTIQHYLTGALDLPAA
ncbi:TetR family transcriptional regulator [Pilimelia terevasa]|uniref:TetR family transcriptional regulator n=1 Tax=Pilimelia terevasa TaxID=53372 RepID=A0A8J3BI80_9ACTN|nr:TetR family transcriptional regulator [Pilimelia terevasa]GGK23031.1 TetR family transcriptional regulator [Pilimelia terevasa]